MTVSDITKNIETELNSGGCCTVVPSEHVFNLLLCLKVDYKFHQLIDLTAVDYLDNGFEIVYVLRNVEDNKIVTIKSKSTRVMQSVTSIFPNAEWYECEVYEMFGIYFTHHPNLRRLFTNGREHSLKKVRQANE